MAANPVFLVVIAVVALVAAVILAYKKSETFRDIVNAAFRSVSAAVAEVVEFIKAHWKLLFVILTGPVGLAVLEIVKHWAEIKAGGAAVVDWVRDHFAAVTEFVTRPFSEAKATVSDIWQAVTQVISDAKGDISSAMSGVKDAVQDVVDVFQAVIDKVDTVIDKIKSIPHPDLPDLPFVGRTAAGTSSGGGGGFSHEPPVVHLHLDGSAYVGKRHGPGGQARPGPQGSRPYPVRAPAMTWHVDIRIGGHTWSIDQADGAAPDDIRPLAGMSFGWTVPRDGLWPVQPDPMQASLALNVPYFNDVADIAEGDPVAIEVRADSAGDVVASFYGDVSTRRATPRADRLGVILSIVAVDSLVKGITELPSTIGTNDGAFDSSNVVLDLSGGTSAFLHAVDLLDYIWVHRLAGGVDLTGLTYTNDDVAMYAPQGSDIRAYIDLVLVQLVNISDLTRMVLSPNIDPATGQVAAAASGRYFTLDTIQASRVVDLVGRPGSDAAPLVFQASAFNRDQLAWNAAKGTTPARIQITGFGNDGTASTEQETPYVAGSPGAGTVALASQLADGADAIALATFYANQLWAPWQVDDLTLLVTDREVDVPVGLFPQWTLPENDPGRASCYVQRVTLTGLQSNLTPDGTDTTTGVLVGATCRITGGRLYLDLSLHTVPADPVEGDAGFRLGAIGEAALGGLATD
jgi:hypothetical protein